MKYTIQIYMTFILGLYSLISYSQEVEDRNTRTATIHIDRKGNIVSLKPDMPPLEQIAGAPKAFYTYYWEFGDGEYSFEEKPKHPYKKDGEYTVRLWSTNNYDSGKPPASRPETIKINSENTNDLTSADLGTSSTVFPEEENLIIKTNRDPLPNQEMVLITSYKNTYDYVTNGVLYLFYNDEQFKNENFILEDTRMYHGEKIVIEPINGIAQTELNSSPFFLSSNDNNSYSTTYSVYDNTQPMLPMTLEESEAFYKNHQQIRFENMQPGEERHIFRTLKTTPEMIKDTSAIVTLRTIYVPDNNYDNHTVKDTELEIVSSHDPNKMSSNGTLMNFRLAKNRKINFKTKFQNDGEGPANTIRLETEISELFDKNTLEVKDRYPECPICPKEEEVNYSCLDTIIEKDKIIFTFKNVHLPGTAQKNVTDRDSTKGFVKFSLRFGDDLYKKKTRNRTAIYFDKNDPVITNYSTTRFLPGVSIGPKAGYIYTPSKDKSNEFFIGAVISPYKSYRGYLQAELFFSAGTLKDLNTFISEDTRDVGIVRITEYTEKIKENNISAYLVPISYRYNVHNNIAFGAGPQLSIDLQNKISTSTNGEAYLNLPREGMIRDEQRDTYIEEKCTKSFTNFNVGLFADISLGQVRIGPSIGFRYVYNFREPHSQLQAYATWKF